VKPEPYLVVNPDGTFEFLQVDPKQLYDVIVDKVGSPFGNARVADGAEMYIRDNGLFDESVINLPLAILGLPICGPVLVHGGADHHGNTKGFTSNPFTQALHHMLKSIQETMQQIEHNRANPFTIEVFNLDEMNDRIAEGLGGSNG
jgi:hypothetical protein